MRLSARDANNANAFTARALQFALDLSEELTTLVQTVVIKWNNGEPLCSTWLES